MKDYNLKLRPDVTVVRHSMESYEFRFGIWNSSSIFVDLETEVDLLALLAELPSELSSREFAERHEIAESELQELVEYLEREQLFVLEIPDPIFSLFGFHEFGSEEARNSFLIAGLASGSILEEALESRGAKVDHLSRSLERSILQASRSTDTTFAMAELATKAKEELAGKTVVFVDEVNNPLFLHTLAVLCRDLRCPFLPVIFDGPFLFIGPMYLDPSPCFECFEVRMLTHVRNKAAYTAYKNSFLSDNISKTESGLSMWSKNIALSLASAQCVAFQMSGSNHVAERLLSVYLPTMEFVYHDLLSVASCSICGLSGGEVQSKAHFSLSELLEANER